MDNTEQLAESVINAVTLYIDKRLAPILSTLEGFKQEMAAGLRALDAARNEQSLIASKSAAEMFATLRVPADGKSITVDDVRPLIEQMVAAIPKPVNGKDADPAAMAAAVSSEVARQVAAIPKPVDGKDADPVTMALAVSSEVARQVATLPKPENGKDADINIVREMVVRAVGDLPRPKDGESVDMSTLFEQISAAVARAVDALPKPRDGKDVDAPALASMIADEVSRQVSLLPRALDGKSVTLEDVRPMLADMVAAIPVPQDGKSVTVDDVRPMLAEMIAAIPVPQDGKSVTVEDVEPIIAARVKAAVEALPAPKDGESVHPDTVRIMVADLMDAAVAKAVAALPPPKDGTNGKDADPLAIAETVRAEITHQFDLLRPHIKGEPGEAGLGFDDMTFDIKDDGRTMVWRFMRDGREKTFEAVASWQIYRGVYKTGTLYKKGDTVSYGGSQFTAKCDTDKAPGTDDWQLSVKRGKDGKDE